MIDWDNLADELADSPRTRLQQTLDEADDIVAVLIVYESRTGEHLASQFSYTSGLAPGAGSSSLLGLAEWVKARLLAGMD